MTGRTIGLIGAGAIGGMILQGCAQGRLECRRVTVFVRRPRAEVQEQVRQIGGAVVHSVDDLIRARPEVIVEAAGHEAVRTYAARVAEAGIDLVLMSVGALANDALRASLEVAARAGGASISIPSGAVGGLDALTAARALGDLERVVHRTIKKPDAFRDVPYVVERRLLPDTLTDGLLIYRGSARDAAQHFPQSVNVAAAVSLAGIGFDRTEVEIVADPDTPNTVHVLQAQGGFGSFILRFENVVDPTNPRTTRLAGLSAVAALQRRHCVLRLI